MTIDDLKDFEDLFACRGWKKLMEQAIEEIDLLRVNALDSVRSFEELCVLRGRALQLQTLLSLEQQIEFMVREEIDANV